MFNIGQQLRHKDLEMTYKVDDILTTNKGNLYTLVAEDCLQGEIRYKRYYEDKLKEKCEILENKNG